MSSSFLVPDASHLRVAVVGDLIADRYHYVRPTRLSREAPVLVMRHERERIGAGGAANVARNLRALGARVRMLGVVGRDESGRELSRLLERDGVDVRGVRACTSWSTPTKTRVLAAEAGRTYQQVLRIDREEGTGFSRQVLEALIDELRGLSGQIDAVLLSDYGYGGAGSALGAAIEHLRDAGVPVLLDPRSNEVPFRGLTAMTPNTGELAAATQRAPEALDDWHELVRAADELRVRTAPRHLLVTRGNRGMALFDDEHPGGISVPPAGPDAVVDVSGAGDTAAAAFLVGLTCGLGAAKAMALANAAAGVVVMESGTAVCGPDELRVALETAPTPGTALAAEATRAMPPSRPGRSARAEPSSGEPAR